MSPWEERRKGVRILIAEDDFTSRVILEKMLSPYGECHLAIDGEEALEAFKEAYQQDRPYHLICLDYLMPEKDGEEVLREIRSMEGAHGRAPEDKAKIIFITGIIDEDDAFKELRPLCDAFMEKPIGSAKLRKILVDLGLLDGSM
jgi:two-component system, chemotaxis family, chemotaxis protein CheY